MKIVIAVLFLVSLSHSQYLTCIIARDSLCQPDQSDTCRIVIAIERYNDVIVYPVQIDTVRAFWRTGNSARVRRGKTELVYPNNCYTVNVVEIIQN